MLEKTLEILWDCKEIQPVHPKGNQSWIFIGRTDAEPKTPILWPPDAKNWLTRKDPDAGKDWRWEEKGTTEDEMVGWHHRLDGHEFGWTPGVGDGQGSLKCCSPWGHRKSDMAERLNWTELIWFQKLILKLKVTSYWKWAGKESACNTGDTGDVGLIPGSGRSPGEGNGNPPQYSCLGNLLDRGAWRATVQGSQRVGQKRVTKHTHT